MAVTFGSATAPSQKTVNFDALFSQSLAAEKKKLTDNISASNSFFHDIMKKDLYEAEEGGTNFEIPLLYELATADWYSGYDELPSTPIDGVTKAVYEWAQAAVPISYHMKEVRQNKKKIIDLVDTKMTQAEMGFQEFFSVALLHGSKPQGGNLHGIPTSTVNGAAGINPLPLLIKYDPTSSTSIGNINQSTSTWWRNRTKTSAATTYDGLMQEFNNLYNTCGLKVGGNVDLILMDQTSYELIQHAYWLKYQKHMETDIKYPFPNVVFGNARIVMDDKVPDVANDAVAATTKGSAFFINTKFFKIKYEESSNFELLRDENGKAFQKPINGDSRLAHIAWMGQTCINNRAKQGVMGNIARTLTVS